MLKQIAVILTLAVVTGIGLHITESASIPTKISSDERDALRIKQIEFVTTQRDLFQLKLVLDERERAFRKLLAETEQKYKNGYKLDENTLDWRK